MKTFYTILILALLFFGCTAIIASKLEFDDYRYNVIWRNIGITCFGIAILLSIQYFTYNI